MTDLDKARENYRFALLELSAAAGKAARTLEDGRKSAQTPYDYGVKEAYDAMWRAYNQVSGIYRRINNGKERNRERAILGSE